MFVTQILSIILISQPLWALPQNIVIDSKLFYQGKKLSSPRITTADGSRAVVSQRDVKGNTKFNLELLPIKSRGNVVQVRYALLIKEGVSQNEIHSRGVVHLQGKQKGKIYLDKGKVEIQLQVNKS